MTKTFNDTHNFNLTVRDGTTYILLPDGVEIDVVTLFEDTYKTIFRPYKGLKARHTLSFEDVTIDIEEIFPLETAAAYYTSSATLQSYIQIYKDRVYHWELWYRTYPKLTLEDTIGHSGTFTESALNALYCLALEYNTDPYILIETISNIIVMEALSGHKPKQGIRLRYELSNRTSLTELMKMVNTVAMSVVA